jgi:cytoskeletal protein RodZ
MFKSILLTILLWVASAVFLANIALSQPLVNSWMPTVSIAQTPTPTANADEPEDQTESDQTEEETETPSDESEDTDAQEDYDMDEIDEFERDLYGD